MTSGHGIVLEFGAPSHHQALIVNPHSSAPLSEAGRTKGRVDQKELQTKVLQNPKATRSLSATVRKKSTSLEEDVATVQLENVLEAVEAENAMLGGATSKKATRSLSATVCKKANPLRATVQLENVLDAVQAENTMVDGATSKKMTQSLSVTTHKGIVAHEEGAVSVEDILAAVHAENAKVDSESSRPHVDDRLMVSNELEKYDVPVDLPSATTQSLPSATTVLQSQILSKSPASISDTAIAQCGDMRTGEVSSKLSFPLKPVLLQYNTSKPSLHPLKPSKFRQSPEGGRGEEGEGEGERGRGEESDEEGREEGMKGKGGSGAGGEEEGEGAGGEDTTASRSLTERTLKVITDKVRNMDAK